VGTNSPVDVTIAYYYPCIYGRTTRFGYRGDGNIFTTMCSRAA
jgi:hypothetical protein